ncbi:unnamed protein product, partial [Effrenium voratum]
MACTSHHCHLVRDPHAVLIVLMVVLWCFTAYLLLRTIGLRRIFASCKDWLLEDLLNSLSNRSLSGPLEAKISEYRLQWVQQGTLAASCGVACAAVPVLIRFFLFDSVGPAHKSYIICGFWALLMVSHMLVKHRRSVVCNVAYVAAMILWSIYAAPLLNQDNLEMHVYVLAIAFVGRTTSLCLGPSRLLAARSEETGGAKGRGHTIGSVCDAVVELDEDLKIVGDSRHLHCWLLHGREGSPEDEELQQFVKETDRALFLKEIRRERQGITTAAAFHLKMRDSAGTTVPVECFHVRFQSTIGERHLLGMREYGESCLQSTQSTSSTAVPASHVVEFDPFSWKCRGFSQAFQCLFPESRRRITEYLAPHCREPFEKKVTDKINRLSYSDQHTDRVTMQLQMMGYPPCSCQLLLSKQEGHMVAQLVLNLSFADLSEVSEARVDRKEVRRESGCILQIHEESSLASYLTLVKAQLGVEDLHGAVSPSFVSETCEGHAPRKSTIRPLSERSGVFARLADSAFQGALVSLVVLWCLTAHLLIQTFGGCRKILRSAIRRCKELGRCGWLPRRQSLADPLAKISEHHVLRVKRATLFLSCCIACIALPLVLSLLWDANLEVSLRILWHCGFWAIMVLTNIIITRWPRCMVLSLAYLLGMTLIMTSPAWTYILDELAAVAVGGLSRLACLSCGPTPTLVFILNAAHSFNTYLNTESSDIAVMFDAFI